MSLQGEGFEDVATCDRLLGDLTAAQSSRMPARCWWSMRPAWSVPQAGLPARARPPGPGQGGAGRGMTGQPAAIDAGGGFRALRLRLGASELVENRRQQQAWEREASSTSSAAAWSTTPWPPTRPMTGWWPPTCRPPPSRCCRTGGRPTAGRPRPHPRGDRIGGPAGRGRPAQQRLPGTAGRPRSPRWRPAPGRGPPVGRRGPRRVRPQRHQRAGVANGSRGGTITALDPHARTLTIRSMAKIQGGDATAVVSGWAPTRGAEPTG